MDEEMNRRLRGQEQRLRETIAVFSQASQRVGRLGDGVGWAGPASTAYGAAIGVLRAELRVAELHLKAALRDTISAIIGGDLGG